MRSVAPGRMIARMETIDPDRFVTGVHVVHVAPLPQRSYRA
jgi:hypothetical protein